MIVLNSLKSKVIAVLAVVFVLVTALSLGTIRI